MIKSENIHSNESQTFVCRRFASIRIGSAASSQPMSTTNQALGFAADLSHTTLTQNISDKLLVRTSVIQFPRTHTIMKDSWNKAMKKQPFSHLAVIASASRAIHFSVYLTFPVRTFILRFDFVLRIWFIISNAFKRAIITIACRRKETTAISFHVICCSVKRIAGLIEAEIGKSKKKWFLLFAAFSRHFGLKWITTKEFWINSYPALTHARLSDVRTKKVLHVFQLFIVTN